MSHKNLLPLLDSASTQTPDPAPLLKEIESLKAELKHMMKCNCDLCGNTFPESDAYCSGCYVTLLGEVESLKLELAERESLTVDQRVWLELFHNASEDATRAQALRHCDEVLAEFRKRWPKGEINS